MGVLSSTLFTQGDPATVKKLDDCATGRPNEVFSHFTEGQSGEHIKRVQQALKNVQELEPGLGIPEFQVSGVYDSAFARAVYVYKEKRGIRNYANKVDDIVGIQTIRSLDNEAKRRKRADPPTRPTTPHEFPRPIPNCLTEADCPVSSAFTVTVLAGVSVGEGIEKSKMFLTIRDTTNGLSALYLLTVTAVGISASPVGVQDGGGPKPFNTVHPVKVTRFGPGATLLNATHPPPFSDVLGVTLMELEFSSDGKGRLFTRPIVLDTGKISIPGLTIAKANVVIRTTCRGGPGARRAEFTRLDIVF